MSKKLVISTICAGLMVMGTNMANASDHRHDYRDRGDRVEKRLDHKGDRINRRLDHAAEHAYSNGHYKKAQRLDKKGDRIDRKLDRKGKRFNRHWDKHNRGHKHGYKRDYYAYAPMGRHSYGGRDRHQHRHGYHKYGKNKHRHDHHKGRKYQGHGARFTDNVTIWLRF